MMPGMLRSGDTCWINVESDSKRDARRQEQRTTLRRFAMSSVRPPHGGGVPDRDAAAKSSTVPDVNSMRLSSSFLNKVLDSPKANGYALHVAAWRINPFSFNKLSNKY